MKYLKTIWAWLKANKWICLSYIVIAVVFGILSNIYLINEIKESQIEIQDEINYGIFANKKSFGIRKESYTIVSYSKSDIPKLSELSDSSSYNQQYGGLNNYFKASGGWSIKVYKKEDNTIVETSIKPYSAGYKSSSNNNPESLFRRLYNNIIADEDYNIDVNNDFKVSKLTSLETKFHKISCRNIGIDEGLMWYDYYDGRAFSELKQDRLYSIDTKHSKIDSYGVLYGLISLLVSTILFIIILRIFNNRKNKKTKSSFNLDISLNKSSENVKDNPVDIEDLLKKINPSNFMSPYNSEKVKIANDLYSALLSSQGNETIISMIKEKASSELGIE